MSNLQAQRVALSNLGQDNFELGRLPLDTARYCKRKGDIELVVIATEIE